MIRMVPSAMLSLPIFQAFERVVGGGGAVVVVCLFLSLAMGHVES